MLSDNFAQYVVGLNLHYYKQPHDGVRHLIIIIIKFLRYVEHHIYIFIFVYIIYYIYILYIETKHTDTGICFLIVSHKKTQDMGQLLPTVSRPPTFFNVCYCSISVMLDHFSFLDTDFGFTFYF